LPGTATLTVFQATLLPVTVELMENHNRAQQSGPTLRDLYPHLDDEQLKEVEENLEQYLAFTLRLYLRICADPKTYEQFKALTASSVTPTMSVERSNQT
jgi:hypothetical protein